MWGFGVSDVSLWLAVDPTCTLPTRFHSETRKVWPRAAKPLARLQGSFIFQTLETTLKLKTFQGLEAPVGSLQGAPHSTNSRKGQVST